LIRGYWLRTSSFYAKGLYLSRIVLQMKVVLRTGARFSLPANDPSGREASMNTLKFSKRLGRLRLLAIPIAILLFFLVLSTSAIADIINVSVTIGNQGNGSGSVTPGLP